jgi:hypothetical protein
MCVDQVGYERREHVVIGAYPGRANPQLLADLAGAMLLEHIDSP